MQNFRPTTALLFFLLAATAAEAQTTLTAGVAARFKNRSEPGRSMAIVKFRRDAALATPLDPTCTEASSVRLRTESYDSGEIPLRCENWQARGSGFKYSDRDGSVGGLTKILYRSGRLTMLFKGNNYAPVPAPFAAIDVSLTVGSTTFCGRFDQFRRNDAALVLATGPTTMCGAGATATATPDRTNTTTSTHTPITHSPTPTSTPLFSNTPTATFTSGPTLTPTPLPTTSNLYTDPGFEVGVNGCFAQEGTDSATRSTVMPIVETGSLDVQTNSYGSHVWCPVVVEDTPNAFATRVDIAAQLRADTVSTSDLAFCIFVYYVDGGTEVQCVYPSRTVGVVTPLAVGIALDPMRELQRLNILLNQEGAAPVRYSMDETSMILTLAAAPPSATPTNAPSGTITPGSTPEPTPTGGLLYLARLTDSGSSTALPLITDAEEPAEIGLTAPLAVGVPNAQCSRLLGFVNPAIAIPTNSNIREVDARFDGVPLPLIDPAGRQVVEEAHAFGSMIPFFKPLFSLTSITPGTGTLEIRGYDSAHNPVSTVTIPNMTVEAPPAPLTAAQIGTIAHPRIWLTPSRLAAARARNPMTDPIAARYYNPTRGVDYFLNALAIEPDPTTPAFAAMVYDPDSYIPALALCDQLARISDPTRAQTCADAAYALVMRMANEYDAGVRLYSRDYGYDIRFELMFMMVAYDWMYDRFTPAERSLLATVATEFVDWYTTAPGYAADQPVENYFAGYLQGIALAALATAGDNPDADRLLALLRDKLNNEVPVLNQRACGGDWAEGWNYGPYTMQEFAMIDVALREVGEDWGAVFDFLQPLARSQFYQESPDYLEMRPFGGYSGDLPHRVSPAMLAVLSSTTDDGAFAAHLFSTLSALPPNGDGSPGGNFRDGTRGFTTFEMIFGDLDQTVSFAGLPLSYFNPGTGRFFSKSSLTDPQAYQVTTDNVSYDGDHYGDANGDVRLYRGSTCLLCPAAYRGYPFRGEDFTTAFSSYLVNGEEQWVSRNNQVLFVHEEPAFSAIGMRFESSYPISRYDESVINPANPLDYLIREVVHLRPGTLIVRDLHRRRNLTDTLTALWHLGSSAAVQSLGGGQYMIDTLRIGTFGSVPVTPTFGVDLDAGSNPIGTLMQQAVPSSTDHVEMVTVFSETETAVAYAGGVLELSGGQCVIFAGGGVSVAACD